MDKIVLCMKWGRLYGPDYVNVLCNAVRAHSSRDLRVVCLTDDRNGISADVECLDIPDIGCTPDMWRRGGWPKLSVFARDLYGLSGRALFVDLDTVIWGSIDPFFEVTDPFVAIDTGPNWRPGGRTGGEDALVGTGIFAFDLGRHAAILEGFCADREQVVQSCRNEQVWVQRNLPEIAYWPRDWVISFKRWLRRPIGLDLFLPPHSPDPQTRIIAFHGDPRPIDLIRKESGVWDRFPHLGRGQVPWMRTYWEGYGGRV